MADIHNGIVTLGEHKWKLPPVPTKKKDIFFAEQDKDKQYWRRLPYPKLVDQYRRGITKEFSNKTVISEDGKYAKSISADDTERLIKFQDEDLARRWKGVWFMNKGEPTYITGSHYFMLQWAHMFGVPNRFTGEYYAQYFEFQRDVHYFMQMVREDPMADGGFIGKPKKTGITQLFSVDKLDLALKYKNKEIGMMSDDQDKCRDTNFKYFLHAYDNIPDLISHPYSVKNKDEIVLANPVGRGMSEEALKKRINAEESLNNHVFTAATTPGAFDAFLMFDAWHDEFPKYKNPREIFNRTKETTKIGGIRNGKTWFTSYVPEENTKGFEEAARIWEESKLGTSKDKSLGDTLSGLKVFPLIADDSYQTDTLRIDIYGKIDKPKVVHYLNAVEKAKKDDVEALQTHKRQYPRSEEDMWSAASMGLKPFDVVRLGARIKVLNNNYSGQIPFEYGRFEYKDKTLENSRVGEIGLVEWIPVTREGILRGETAPFKMYYKEYLDPDMFNYAVRKNLRHSRSGLLLPADRSGTPALPFDIGGLRSTGGCDTTDYVEDSRVIEGSKNAIIIGTLPNTIMDARAGKQISGLPYLEYCHRPENPDDFYKDLVKAMLYTSSLMYVEGNKPWVGTRLIQDGLGYFIVMKNKKTQMMDLYKPYEEQAHMITTAAGQSRTTSDIVMCLKRILKMPAEGERDAIELIESLELLKQARDFNPKETKRYDLLMAYGFKAILDEALMGWQMRRESKVDKKQMRRLFNVLTGGRGA